MVFITSQSEKLFVRIMEKRVRTTCLFEWLGQQKGFEMQSGVRWLNLSNTIIK